MPGNFGGPRRNFGGPREMHKATCSNCKKECEVPFKPQEGREVFCLDCWKKKNERN
ncbi:MAG: CxxC-x17-CxxC domain-containing protein [Nanoarchaeota archaeon]